MPDEHNEALVEGVVSQIPSGLFILTTAFDGLRSGLLAKWVQRCSLEPPMVMVAIPKGQPVEPLILDSRTFVLCHISPDDRFLLRKFASPPDRNEDPFVAISTANAPSGAPIIDRALSYLDCQVIRHIELESDHRVYVGQVTTAGLLRSYDTGVNGQVDQHKQRSA
ncbi:MAG: flavin reductase family protein [Planctomycetota bacterium]|jgi:flavin reductase (DIM6/NTAB) family NADH-FMN oxidoreductase RutF